MTSIQDSIIEVMSSRNMSQAELSRMSGVSKSSLSRYLGGDDIPASKLKAIADALDVSVDKLLGLAPAPAPSPALPPDEAELLRCFRSMDGARRARLLESARDYAALSVGTAVEAGAAVRRAVRR